MPRKPATDGDFIPDSSPEKPKSSKMKPPLIPRRPNRNPDAQNSGPTRTTQGSSPRPPSAASSSPATPGPSTQKEKMSQFLRRSTRNTRGSRAQPQVSETVSPSLTNGNADDMPSQAGRPRVGRPQDESNFLDSVASSEESESETVVKVLANIPTREAALEVVDNISTPSRSLRSKPRVSTTGPQMAPSAGNDNGDEVADNKPTPRRSLRVKPRLSIAGPKTSPSAVDENADEEGNDGEHEPRRAAAKPSGSKRRGKKNASEPEYHLCGILDEKVVEVPRIPDKKGVEVSELDPKDKKKEQLYLTEWEPCWEPLKANNDPGAIKGQLDAWKNLKYLREEKDYPKRMSWSYLPAHNPSSILGPPYGQEILHFTNGKGLPKDKGNGKEKEQANDADEEFADKPSKRLDIRGGILWMEQNQGVIERELVRHLFNEHGRNGHYGNVIFPVVNDKARGTILLPHKARMGDPKSHPYALVRSEVREVTNPKQIRLTPPFIPSQTSESPGILHQTDHEIRITLMANPLYWTDDSPSLPIIPCGALALRGLEVLSYHLDQGDDNNKLCPTPQYFWPRSFNVFNLLTDALVTKVCDPPGYPGFSLRTGEKGNVKTTLSNEKELNAHALTDVRCMPSVELLGYDDLVRWWTVKRGWEVGGGEGEGDDEGEEGEEGDGEDGGLSDRVEGVTI